MEVMWYGTCAVAANPLSIVTNGTGHKSRMNRLKIVKFGARAQHMTHNIGPLQGQKIKGQVTRSHNISAAKAL